MNTLASQASINSKISAVCDIMRRSNCASALQYLPELTWLLFLRVLDERESLEAEEAAAVQVPFQPSLESPYRWQDWADPKGDKRKELQSGVFGETLAFVNEDLLPKLHSLAEQSRATPRQRVVGQIMRAVESVRIDTEKNFMDVVDAVHKIKNAETDPTHLFLLSQAYESLLLRMGEKNNDGGQFFTPREVIRAMVGVVDPKPGETVYDPGCGTGGFLAQSYEYIRDNLGQSMTADRLEQLRNNTEVGWEKWTPKSDKLERRRCQDEEGPARKVYQGIPAGSSEAGIGRESVIARGRASVVLTAIDVGVLGEAI